MNLLPNKRDAFLKPITDTRISASEWNQLVGSCMAFITEAGFTPDASDNKQFLNAFKAIAASLELVGANTNLSNLTPTGEAKFNAKVDLDGSNATFAHIVETYSNGTDWYRVWSDGWCEQGGQITGSHQNVTFYKKFADTNYCINIQQVSTGSTNNSYFGAMKVDNLQTTYFHYSVGQNENPNTRWEAKGYIAQD